ncbi:MAG: penicillin-binding protein activator LpoB [Candidatus Cloacimonetes bacterium]|nr:penicillin-binding protein activator LpoB [Candidatus Cloacimonadota bacterium]
MKAKSVLLTFLVMSLFLISCGGPSRTVSRISTDTVTDLSGRWNDTDAKLVAEQMISDVTSRPWLSDFLTENGKKPTVIVGTVRNLSSEHIETGTFIKSMERELINSGKVRFVASSEERSEIRQERSEQQIHASEETAKRLAAETGADYMLKGSIKTNIDAVDNQEVKFYQVDLELIDVETNEKVWIGTKEIKKFVEKSRTKW